MLQYQTEDEFLNELVDHEYNHIDIFSGKVQLSVDANLMPELQQRAFDVNGDLAEAFQEFFAYSSQINAFSRRNLRESYKRKIIDAYLLDFATCSINS